MKATQDYKKLVTDVLMEKAALRTDKSGLTTSKQTITDLIDETPEPTSGKTPSSVRAYTAAKEEAKKAQVAAQSVLDKDNPSSDEVELAISKLNEKIAELKLARSELVTAATDDQKDELSKVEETLKPADTADKTPKSVEAYNKEIEKLQAELDAAKRDAKAVVDKGEEATKAEASEAQVKVAAVRAKLVEAGKLLTDKADKADLTAARAIDEINRINLIPSPRHLLTTNNQPGNSSNVNTTEPTSPSDSGQANSGQDGRSTDSGSTTTARSSVAPVTTTEPSANTANREDDTVRSATQGQGILDKSELSKQTQTLENLLRLLTGVSNPTTDSARLVLVEAKKALADDSLTEQGLRHILQTVKDAIASLESIKESQSATKDGGQTAGKETAGEDESANQTQVPVGIIAASILVLLGLLFFLLARRNKESELEKLVKELSKLLKDLNLETVDKDILENSQEELQKAVLFLADEKGSEHTEAELIDNLKEVIAKLTANA